MEGSPARAARAAPRGRSPGAPSPAPPSRGSFSAASSSDAARSGGTSVGGSREWGLGALSGRPPSDAELAAAEERADALKERFALATDPGEQEELLELATEATLLVNTMRAERAFTPAHARAAADEARRALAPERKMLAELLEDASSRREERDARASHALVDVVRARSPVRPAPPRAPVDERVPPARASPTGDAVLRPRRASASPARGDAPLPPVRNTPADPRASPGEPRAAASDDTRRDRSPGPPASRTAARRERARASSSLEKRAIGAAAHSPPPRIIRASTDHSRETPSKPADASVAEPPSVAEPSIPASASSPARRSAVSSDGAREKAAVASSVAHAAAIRLQRVQRGRAARARVKTISERRRALSRSRDGALRSETDEDESYVAARAKRRAALDAAGLAADRVAARAWAEAKFSAGGVPTRGTRNDGVSSAGGSADAEIAEAADQAIRDRGIDRSIERASERTVRRARPATASSASGGGGGGGGGGGVSASSARRRARALTDPRARSGVRGAAGGRAVAFVPRVATLKKKRAGVAESESVAAGGRSGAAKGSVSSSPGGALPRRVAFPGEEKFYERQAKARSREAEREGAGGEGAGARTREAAREGAASTPAKKKREETPERTGRPSSAIAFAEDSSALLRGSFDSAVRVSDSFDALGGDSDDADDAPPEVRSAARRAREARVALAEAEAAVAAAKVRAGRDDVAGAEDEKTILRRTPPRTLRTPPSTPPREKAVRDSKASLRGSTSGADAARASPPRPRSAPAEAVPSGARSRRARSRDPGARSRSHSIGASSSRARTSAPSSPAARASFASAFTVAPGARRRASTLRARDASRRAKAYAESVRERSATAYERKLRAEAETLRGQRSLSARSRDERKGRLARAFERRAGEERAAALRRSAGTYARDAYRGAVVSAFSRYYAAKSSGATFLDSSFEKELASAVENMPAFANLPRRHLPRVFEAAQFETWPKGSVVWREGARSDAMAILVGGEMALFQKPSNAKGPEALEPDHAALWVRPRGRGSGSLFFRPRPFSTRPGSAPDPSPRPRLRSSAELALPGSDAEARALGAPAGAGPLARRARCGEAHGQSAVTGARGGEARCATAVALSDVSALVVRKWAYDAILASIEKAESASAAAFLRSTELFPTASVSDADVSALAAELEHHACSPGDAIVRAGDAAAGVFFVRGGRAEVFARGRARRDVARRRDEAEAEAAAKAREAEFLGREPALLRGEGVGGGVRGSIARAEIADALSPREEDVFLGALVAPALFGEECLAEAGKRDGGGFAAHAFTVLAAAPEGVEVLRLAPERLDALPRAIASRLRRLGRSTAAASAEARAALEETTKGASKNNVTRAEDARIAFGTSRAPPPPLTDPDAPRPATRASVEEGRRPVGVGLGGGGGRTREVATPEARARQLRRTNKTAVTDEERYEAFVGGSETFSSRSLGGTPAGKTNARNALSPTSASAPGSSARARYDEGEGGFRDDSAALAAAAALREAAAAARRLRASRREPRTPGPGGYAARRNARQNAAPVVRLTKKAAALAERNRPGANRAANSNARVGEDVDASRGRPVAATTRNKGGGVYAPARVDSGYVPKREISSANEETARLRLPLRSESAADSSPGYTATVFSPSPFGARPRTAGGFATEGTEANVAATLATSAAARRRARSAGDRVAEGIGGGRFEIGMFAEEEDREDAWRRAGLGVGRTR